MSGDQPGVLRAEVRAPVDLESVLHALPMRVSLVGTDGRVRFVNAAAARHFGERPDLLGRTTEDLIGSDAVTAEAPYVSGVLAGDAQRHYRRSVLPDGTDRYDEIRLLPVADGYVVCARDATAPMRAQHALRTNRSTASVLAEQHRLAAELDDAVVSGIEAARHELAQAIAQEDEEAAAPWVAAAAQRLARVLISLGSTAVNLQLEETGTDPVALADAMADALADARPTASHAPGPRPAPPPSGLEAPTLLAVIEAVPVGVTVLDADGEVLLANPASTTLTDTARTAWARHRETLRSGHGPGDETYDGGAGHVRVRCVPLPGAPSATGANGATRGAPVVVVVEDVDAEVAAAEALRASQQRVGDLHEQRQLAEELHSSVLGQLDTASRLLTGVPEPGMLPHVLAEVDRAAADLRGAAAVLRGEGFAPDR